MESFTCRVCLEDDDMHNMIAPCGCKGTSLLIHKTCLDSCRRDVSKRISCQVCRVEYDMPYSDDDDEDVEVEAEYEEEEPLPQPTSCYHVFAFIVYLVLLITTIVNVSLHVRDRNGSYGSPGYMLLGSLLITFVYAGVLETAERAADLIQDDRYALSLCVVIVSVSTAFIPMACYKVHKLKLYNSV